MESAMIVIFKIVILIFSVVIHEVSHGYAALALGDKTAQHAGRLTLNPVKHLDVFGSLLLPGMMALLGGPVFGWAKPVPYNPYNLQNQKWGPAIVGAAGPLANIAIALCFGLFIRFWHAPVGIAYMQAGSALFIFLNNFAVIAGAIAILNLVLAVFNLIPIPPLDGSKVLFALLPYNWRHLQEALERYGMFLLLIFIFFFAQWLSPIIDILFRLIVGR